MKLLIVTQIVDSEHPILGFFHRWIEEFANHCEEVHVLCLEEGTHHLPEHVLVHSLGKEKGLGRIQRLRRFYTYIWSLRDEYGAVFVHMNPIYVVLGGVLWRVLGKKIGLWYTHGTVTLQLRVATLLAHTVFTASEESFRIKSKKVQVVGHGIDIELFKPQTSNLKPQTSQQSLRLVAVGRVSCVKRQDLAVRALAELRAQGVDVLLSIIGTPLTDRDREYEHEVRELVRTLRLDEHVVWLGAVSNTALPKYLHKSDILVHTSETGSLDKVILEALASGVLLVTTSSAVRKSLPTPISEVSYSEDSPKSIVLRIQGYAQGNINKVLEEGRIYVTQNHSLQRLITSIVGIIKQ